MRTSLSYRDPLSTRATKARWPTHVIILHPSRTASPAPVGCVLATTAAAWGAKGLLEYLADQRCARRNRAAKRRHHSIFCGCALSHARMFLRDWSKIRM